MYQNKKNHTCLGESNNNNSSNLADWAINIFHHYRFLKSASESYNFSWVGEQVAEFGSAPNPWLSLNLLIGGASHVYNSNILPIGRTLDANGVAATYGLWDAISTQHKTAKKNIEQLLKDLDRNVSKIDVPPSLLTVASEIASEDCDLPEGALGLIFSLAVMEHVAEAEKFLAKAFKALRPGGISLHFIDFRDHRDFSKPSEFLYLSRESYIAQTGGSENRIRAFEFTEKFTEAGFEIVDARYQVEPWPGCMPDKIDPLKIVSMSIKDLYPYRRNEVPARVEEDQKARMATPFRYMSLEELSVISSVVVAQKPE